MEESSTYQAILSRGISRGIEQGLERGRIDEARRMLVLACSGRLGEPDAATTTMLDSIDDVTRLESLMRRLSAVETWEELLAS